MWKIFVGFVVFAALALYILQKSGGNVDLGGEKHEVPPASNPAPVAAPASATPLQALPVASAASAP